METTLLPETNFRRRFWVVGILLLPVLFAPHLLWWMRLVACIVPCMLTGTYRISMVDGDRFRTQLFIAFLPTKPMKCNLPGVLYVETKYNSSSFLTETLPFLGVVQFFFITMFDLLMPALGGAYEIWLVTAKGREIIAWQGFDQKCFDQNVALLVARSGAELRGRSR